jgi:hypothetical protein
MRRPSLIDLNLILVLDTFKLEAIMPASFATLLDRHINPFIGRHDAAWVSRLTNEGRPNVTVLQAWSGMLSP